MLFYYIFRIFARRFAEIIVHTLAQTDDFLGTDGHGFKKRHGWAARWVKAIFAKGYTKV